MKLATILIAAITAYILIPPRKHTLANWNTAGKTRH